VITGIGFAFEQVAAPSVVTMAPEGITYFAAVFTGNQNAHSKGGSESLKCGHGGGAGSLGSVALGSRCFALETVVIDASCVLALGVEVAELLDLSGGHWIELVDGRIVAHWLDKVTLASFDSCNSLLTS